MNCTNCGIELRPDSRFCHECGTPIAAIPEAVPQPPAEIRVEGVKKPLPLYSEWSIIVEVPAHFARQVLLLDDTRLWGEMADSFGLPLTSIQKTWWEGEPWKVGSAFVIKGKAIGIPSTSRMIILPPGPRELYRHWQKCNRFAPAVAAAYLVDEVDLASCEIRAWSWREGTMGTMDKWIAGKVKDKAQGWVGSRDDGKEDKCRPKTRGRSTL